MTAATHVAPLLSTNRAAVVVMPAVVGGASDSTTRVYSDLCPSMEIEEAWLSALVGRLQPDHLHGRDLSLAE